MTTMIHALAFLDILQNLRFRGKNFNQSHHFGDNIPAIRPIMSETCMFLKIAYSLKISSKPKKTF